MYIRELNPERGCFSNGWRLMRLWGGVGWRKVGPLPLQELVKKFTSPSVHYPRDKSPPLYPTLRQANPVHYFHPISLTSSQYGLPTMCSSAVLSSTFRDTILWTFIPLFLDYFRLGNTKVAVCKWTAEAWQNRNILVTYKLRRKFNK